MLTISSAGVVPVEQLTEVTEYVSDGVILRCMHIPAGVFVLGHKHTTNHLNIVLKGAIRVTINNEVREFKAPYIFEALADSIKMGVALEDTMFVNVFPTNGKTRDETMRDVADYDYVTNNLNKILGGLICLSE